MKVLSHSITVTVNLPTYNFKQKDKEFYDKYKYYIILNIIKQKYIDLEPEIVCGVDTLQITFNMSNFPKYDILGSLLFYEIPKREILEEMKKYKQQIEKLPVIQ